jgi:hypothetical protein
MVYFTKGCQNNQTLKKTRFKIKDKPTPTLFKNLMFFVEKLNHAQISAKHALVSESQYPKDSMTHMHVFQKAVLFMAR